jgi:hypothetical protein
LLPDTGTEADVRQPAHSDFTRQTCNNACPARLAAQRFLPVFWSQMSWLSPAR